MTKTFTFEGEPLTDERAEGIASETLADLDAMSDGEARGRTRPAGEPREATGAPAGRVRSPLLVERRPSAPSNGSSRRIPEFPFRLRTGTCLVERQRSPRRIG